MNDVFYTMSAMADGSMSKAVSDDERHHNRQAFLKRHDIMLEQSVLVHLSYDTDDFCKYYEVSTEQAGDGMAFDSSIIADALFTRSKHVALFLPVADCIGALLYDPRQQLLGLAHLGRHNLVQTGATKAVQFMQELGSNPADISVWLSPAASRQSYPLYDFDNRSLHEVAIGQLTTAGVAIDAIDSDQRDTTRDDTLFSHSEFLKGNRAVDGRQAVVAMMRP